MSGVAIVRFLLANNEPLVDVVPADDIKGGILPLKTPLPAIGIKEVSAMPHLDVEMRSTSRLITERVQVTVLTKDYPSKKAIHALVRAALPRSKGTVNGIACDSIVPDITGPDFDEPETGIYEQSRDYIVRWHE